MGLKKFKQRVQRYYFAPELSKYLNVDETVLHEHLVELNRAKKGFNKVFCIGYNKTGTTTLERVLRDLGLKLPNQRLQEVVLSHVLVSGRYDILRRFVTKYDAFQDVPFSQEQLYIALDALFPNSKFILTLRNPDEWYSSLVRFHQKTFGFDDPLEAGPKFWAGIRNNYFFEQKKRFVTRVENGTEIVDWNLLYDRNYCISTYTQRNDQIIRYFRQRPSDLLMIDLTSTKDTTEICRFLEVPQVMVQSMPHLNSSKV